MEFLKCFAHSNKPTKLGECANYQNSRTDVIKTQKEHYNACVYHVKYFTEHSVSRLNSIFVKS